MELVCYNNNDIYLIGNPQITFFKAIYRRHTNFSTESIELSYYGSIGFNRKISRCISRNGDLVKGLYLETEFSEGKAVSGIGNVFVKECELQIGSKIIDRHYSDWLNIWTELSIPEGKRQGYDDMVGNLPSMINTDSSGTNENKDYNGENRRYYTPFQFWFCRNIGLALPLIALSYHEVKIHITFNTIENCQQHTTGKPLVLSSCRLYCDYVYLDTDERRRFAQTNHEYLIEQVQFTGDIPIYAKTDKNIKLNFNNPVKELIWVFKSDGQNIHPFNYSNLGSNDTTNKHDSFVSAKIQFNGIDRFSERYADYFRKTQNIEHHSRSPRTVKWGMNGQYEDRCQYIYTYSFALKPEEYQPSGTCNFSQIDDAILRIKRGKHNTTDGILKIYAVNYNVFRLMHGIGDLAY